VLEDKENFSTKKTNNHLKKKIIIVLTICAFPILVLGQNMSIFPSQLSENIIGNWIDEKNNLALVVTKKYIIIQNKLWYFNEIIQEKEILNITCVHNFNVKYITISNINSSNIFLDEIYKITKLTKVKNNTIKQLPKLLIGNWLTSKNKIEIFEKEIRYLKSYYTLDYAISINKQNYYFVVYRDGEYYLCFNIIKNNDLYLDTNFSKQILFKQESFFQKHFLKFISIIILSLSIIGFYLFKWKLRLTKKKEVTKRKFVEMQLKSIRSQMNPHFLFNALSAIQNLINKEENDKANHYLTEFSQLMRLTLDKSEKGLESLSDEIKSIEKYLELEKLRCPFEYTIKLDSKINANLIEVPAMLIQPFIENAIIHGLNEIKGDKKLSIEFKIKSLSLVCIITDNGIGINKALLKRKESITTANTKRYGVKLAKDRISLINESYNTNAEIQIIDISTIDSNKTGTLIKICMPLKY